MITAQRDQRDQRTDRPPLSHDEAAQCEGKSRFPSGTAAFRAAVNVNNRKRKGKKAPHARVYRCPHCGGWHFGQNLIKRKSC